MFVGPGFLLTVAGLLMVRSSSHARQPPIYTEQLAEITTCSAVFEVTDCDGRQVISPRKLASIKQVSRLGAGCIMKQAILIMQLLTDCIFSLQMLNIHLRGQEVPACNAGKLMHGLLACSCVCKLY